MQNKGKGKINEKDVLPVTRKIINCHLKSRHRVSTISHRTATQFILLTPTMGKYIQVRDTLIWIGVLVSKDQRNQEEQIVLK